MNLKFSFFFLTGMLVLMNSGACFAQRYVKDTTPVYDYHPRRDVIFQDDFSRDKVGTFPRKWDICNCKAMMKTNSCCAVYAGSDGKELEIDHFVYNGALLEPDIGNFYINDSFTIDYDFKMSEDDDHVLLGFSHTKNSEPCLDNTVEISQENNKIVVELAGWKDGTSKPFIHSENTTIPFDFSTWHHFSISYINENYKVYIDQRRLISVYDCDYYPKSFFLSCNRIARFRNVRLATHKLMSEFDSILTQMKFITHAINFDNNKAVIKTESNIYIQQLADWLKLNQEVRIEIDGHTDNVGAAADNKKLSASRALAVKDMLISMGIDKTRLIAKGFGSTMPIQPNNTAEGKANNRRVELIKL